MMTSTITTNQNNLENTGINVDSEYNWVDPKCLYEDPIKDQCKKKMWELMKITRDADPKDFEIIKKHTENYKVFRRLSK